MKRIISMLAHTLLNGAPVDYYGIGDYYLLRPLDDLNEMIITDLDVSRFTMEQDEENQ